MATRDLKNRLEKVSQGRQRLTVVFAPPGADPREFHYQVFGSSTDVVVLDGGDRDL